jgi:hypothetical protein
MEAVTMEDAQVVTGTPKAADPVAEARAYGVAEIARRAELENGRARRKAEENRAAGERERQRDIGVIFDDQGAWLSGRLMERELQAPLDERNSQAAAAFGGSPVMHREVGGVTYWHGPGVLGLLQSGILGEVRATRMRILRVERIEDCFVEVSNAFALRPSPHELVVNWTGKVYLPSLRALFVEAQEPCADDRAHLRAWAAQDGDRAKGPAARIEDVFPLEIGVVGDSRLLWIRRLPKPTGGLVPDVAAAKA